MPEKYELFLDKNKKVKLAANDQGDFFAEANGNRIKLGEQGLQTINKTTGAPESVGGAPDPNQVIRTITGIETNAFGEDSGRTTFTHSSLPGETLIGWYAQLNNNNPPRLFLQVNQAYINTSNATLSAPDGTIVYGGNNGPFKISLKINGNVYGPMRMNLDNASWYNASQVALSANHDQIVIQYAHQDVSNFSAMEADLLAVANTTELAGNAGGSLPDSFSAGFSGRIGGIYGLPLSADIQLYIVQDIDVTTPIKFSETTNFTKKLSIVTDNEAESLFKTTDDFSTKTPYSSGDQRWNHQAMALDNVLQVSGVKTGGLYKINEWGPNYNSINDIFTNNSTHEFLGIEIEFDRYTDESTYGITYVDFLMGMEGFLNGDQSGKKHLIFYSKNHSQYDGSGPGEYFIYTLYGADNAPNTGSQNSTGLAYSTDPNGNGGYGDNNPIEVYYPGRGHRLRLEINGNGYMYGYPLDRGVDKNPGYGRFGQFGIPGNIVNIDVRPQQTGKMGDSDSNANPYAFNDYSSGNHINIKVTPGTKYFITDGAWPSGSAFPPNQVIGIIFDCKHLKQGDEFGYAFDHLGNGTNSWPGQTNYGINIVFAFGNNGYQMWSGYRPNYGGSADFRMNISEPSGIVAWNQLNGGSYSTATMNTVVL